MTLLDLFTGNFTWLQLLRGVIPVVVVSAAMLYAGYWRGRLYHYLSTACFHGLHDQCRLTCKTCRTLCRCKCHKGDAS